MGGHLAVGVMAGLAVPFGSISSQTAQDSLMGQGLQLGGDATFGISRTVVLGIYGQVAMPSGNGSWASRDVSSIAVGPLVRYHLVQGTRFDPWISAGAGFRRTTAGSDDLTGLDFARLQLGGDWYATSQLGFGPLLECALGTVLDSSSAALGTGGVYAHFVIGGRVVFDTPGK